jgi:4'-phosphopantetheinyl transferase
MSTLWSTPPDPLVLEREEVHVWRATLDLPAYRVQALEQTLAPDEGTRAQKYHFQKDRIHFIVARGLLRAILARYLDRDATALRFTYNEYGKPALVEEAGDDSLSFNVSHSHGMALHAITRNWAVGIDLEWINKDIEPEQIAGRFFSPYEIAMLRSVPKELLIQAFFDCWTRKEAYIKARGMGLSLALDQFDVSLVPGLPAEILANREANQDIARWPLYELFPGEDYKAALAVEGKPVRLQYWQWSEQKR